jgi:hypothetical protein
MGMTAFAIIVMIGSMMGLIAKLSQHDLDLDYLITFIFALSVLLYIN